MSQATLIGIGQRLIDLLYPPQCLACVEPTDSAHGLCGACWREVSFIAGPVCERCGVPVLNALSRTHGLLCDSCTQTPPIWNTGRAAMLYEGAGKRMILGLKHGDRQDLVRPMGRWMTRAGGNLIGSATLIVPVPLHWIRLAKRQFNQAAALANAIARETGVPCVPDALTRQRSTESQGQKSRADRHLNLAGAFCATPSRERRLKGARVLLVDDVMTSGATLSACAEVCREAGADTVDVLVAARVAKLE